MYSDHQIIETVLIKTCTNPVARSENMWSLSEALTIKIDHFLMDLQNTVNITVRMQTVVRHQHSGVCFANRIMHVVIRDIDTCKQNYNIL